MAPAASSVFDPGTAVLRVDLRDYSQSLPAHKVPPRREAESTARGRAASDRRTGGRRWLAVRSLLPEATSAGGRGPLRSRSAGVCWRLGVIGQAGRRVEVAEPGADEGCGLFAFEGLSELACAYRLADVVVHACASPLAFARCTSSQMPTIAPTVRTNATSGTKSLERAANIQSAGQPIAGPRDATGAALRLTRRRERRCLSTANQGRAVCGRRPSWHRRVRAFDAPGTLSTRCCGAVSCRRFAGRMSSS